MDEIKIEIYLAWINSIIKFQLKLIKQMGTISKYINDRLLVIVISH